MMTPSARTLLLAALLLTALRGAVIASDRPVGGRGRSGAGVLLPPERALIDSAKRLLEELRLTGRQEGGCQSRLAGYRERQRQLRHQRDSLGASQPQAAELQEYAILDRQIDQLLPILEDIQAAVEQGQVGKLVVPFPALSATLGLDEPTTLRLLKHHYNCMPDHAEDSVPESLLSMVKTARKQVPQQQVQAAPVSVPARPALGPSPVIDFDGASSRPKARLAPVPPNSRPGPPPVPGRSSSVAHQEPSLEDMTAALGRQTEALTRILRGGELDLSVGRTRELETSREGFGRWKVRWAARRAALAPGESDRGQPKRLEAQHVELERLMLAAGIGSVELEELFAFYLKRSSSPAIHAQFERLQISWSNHPASLTAEAWFEWPIDAEERPELGRDRRISSRVPPGVLRKLLADLRSGKPLGPQVERQARREDVCGGPGAPSWCTPWAAPAATLRTADALKTLQIGLDHTRRLIEAGSIGAAQRNLSRMFDFLGDSGASSFLTEAAPAQADQLHKTLSDLDRVYRSARDGQPTPADVHGSLEALALSLGAPQEPIAGTLDAGLEEARARLEKRLGRRLEHGEVAHQATQTDPIAGPVDLKAAAQYGGLAALKSVLPGASKWAQARLRLLDLELAAGSDPLFDAKRSGTRQEGQRTGLLLSYQGGRSEFHAADGFVRVSLQEGSGPSVEMTSEPAGKVVVKRGLDLRLKIEPDAEDGRSVTFGGETLRFPPGDIVKFDPAPDGDVRWVAVGKADPRTGSLAVHTFRALSGAIGGQRDYNLAVLRAAAQRGEGQKPLVEEAKQDWPGPPKNILEGLRFTYQDHTEFHSGDGHVVVSSEVEEVPFQEFSYAPEGLVVQWYDGKEVYRHTERDGKLEGTFFRREFAASRDQAVIERDQAGRIVAVDIYRLDVGSGKPTTLERRLTADGTDSRILMDGKITKGVAEGRSVVTIAPSLIQDLVAEAGGDPEKLDDAELRLRGVLRDAEVLSSEVYENLSELVFARHSGLRSLGDLKGLRVLDGSQLELILPDDRVYRGFLTSHGDDVLSDEGKRGHVVFYGIGDGEGGAKPFRKLDYDLDNGSLSDFTASESSGAVTFALARRAFLAKGDVFHYDTRKPGPTAVESAIAIVEKLNHYPGKVMSALTVPINTGIYGGVGLVHQAVGYFRDDVLQRAHGYYGPKQSTIGALITAPSWFDEESKRQVLIDDFNYFLHERLETAAQRKEFLFFADQLVRQSRQKAYEDPEAFALIHGNPPITTMDRAIAAAAHFGLGNQTGLLLQYGKETKGWWKAGFYAAAATGIGVQAYADGRFGIGKFGTMLKQAGGALKAGKVMAVVVDKSGRVLSAERRLTLSEVADAAKVVGGVQQGEAWLGGLSRAEAAAANAQFYASRAAGTAGGVQAQGLLRAGAFVKRADALEGLLMKPMVAMPLLRLGRYAETLSGDDNGQTASALDSLVEEAASNLPMLAGWAHERARAGTSGFYKWARGPRDQPGAGKTVPKVSADMSDSAVAARPAGDPALAPKARMVKNLLRSVLRDPEYAELTKDLKHLPADAPEIVFLDLPGTKRAFYDEGANQIQISRKLKGLSNLELIETLGHEHEHYQDARAESGKSNSDVAVAEHELRSHEVQALLARVAKLHGEKLAAIGREQGNGKRREAHEDPESVAAYRASHEKVSQAYEDGGREGLKALVNATYPELRWVDGDLLPVAKGDQAKAKRLAAKAREGKLSPAELKAARELLGSEPSDVAAALQEHAASLEGLIDALKFQGREALGSAGEGGQAPARAASASERRFAEQDARSPDGEPATGGGMLAAAADKIRARLGNLFGVAAAPAEPGLAAGVPASGPKPPRRGAPVELIGSGADAKGARFEPRAFETLEKARQDYRALWATNAAYERKALENGDKLRSVEKQKAGREPSSPKFDELSREARALKSEIAKIDAAIDRFYALERPQLERKLRGLEDAAGIEKPFSGPVERFSGLEPKAAREGLKAEAAAQLAPGQFTAFLGDLHLDPGNPSAAANLRWNKTLEMLRERRPGYVVLMGDVLDAPSSRGLEYEQRVERSLAVAGQVAEAMGFRSLEEARGKIYFVTGNHDVPWKEGSEPAYIPRARADIGKGTKAPDASYSAKRVQQLSDALESSGVVVVTKHPLEFSRIPAPGARPAAPGAPTPSLVIGHDVPFGGSENLGMVLHKKRGELAAADAPALRFGAGPDHIDVAGIFADRHRPYAITGPLLGPNGETVAGRSLVVASAGTFGEGRGKHMPPSIMFGNFSPEGNGNLYHMDVRDGEFFLPAQAPYRRPALDKISHRPEIVPLDFMKPGELALKAEAAEAARRNIAEPMYAKTGARTGVERTGTGPVLGDVAQRPLAEANLAGAKDYLRKALESDRIKRPLGRYFDVVQSYFKPGEVSQTTAIAKLREALDGGVEISFPKDKFEAGMVSQGTAAVYSKKDNRIIVSERFATSAASPDILAPTVLHELVHAMGWGENVAHRVEKMFAVRAVGVKGEGETYVTPIARMERRMNAAPEDSASSTAGPRQRLGDLAGDVSKGNLGKYLDIHYSPQDLSRNPDDRFAPFRDTMRADRRISSALDRFLERSNKGEAKLTLDGADHRRFVDLASREVPEAVSSSGEVKLTTKAARTLAEALSRAIELDEASYRPARPDPSAVSGSDDPWAAKHSEALSPEAAARRLLERQGAQSGAKPRFQYRREGKTEPGSAADSERLNQARRLIDRYLKERLLAESPIRERLIKQVAERMDRLEWTVDPAESGGEHARASGRSITMTERLWTEVNVVDLAGTILHESIHSLIGNAELPAHVVQADFYLFMNQRLAQERLGRDLKPQASFFSGLRNPFSFDSSFQRDLKSLADHYQAGTLADYIVKTYPEKSREALLGTQTPEAVATLAQRYKGKPAAEFDIPLLAEIIKRYPRVGKK